MEFRKKIGGIAVTREKLYETLKFKFSQILKQYHIEDDAVTVSCRALTPQEAIGETARKDFPIITGKDVMIEAKYRGHRGQAFTDAPTAFSGTLAEILQMEIARNSHNCGIFVATLNAVMSSVGLCSGTVHCRTDGPEQCALDMLAFLRENYPHVRRIALIGYQPALLEMLSGSEYEVRVLDLNPGNIGQERYGVMVEDGAGKKNEIIHSFADLILCTGSTLCNGTIVDYIDLPVEVLFFGITIAGSAGLLGLKRVCFAEKYEK